MPDAAETYEHQIATAQAAGAEVKDYDSSASYSPGELVRSPYYELGVVIRVADDGIELFVKGGELIELPTKTKPPVTAESSR